MLQSNPLGTYAKNRLNGLIAHCHFDPGDLPHVDSNLDEPTPGSGDLDVGETGSTNSEELARL